MEDSEHMRVEDLEHLAKLKQDGVLSEHEFEVAKARLLANDVGKENLTENEQDQTILSRHQEPIYKRWWFWVPIAIIFVSLLLFLLPSLITPLKNALRPSPAGTSRLDTSDLRLQGTNSFTAQEVFDAYESNELKAENTFKGRELWVTGKVYLVWKDNADRRFVALSTSDTQRPILCYLADSSSGLNLVPKSMVTLHGRCEGKPEAVIVLDTCRLAKPLPMGQESKNVAVQDQGEKLTVDSIRLRFYINGQFSDRLAPGEILNGAEGLSRGSKSWIVGLGSEFDRTTTAQIEVFFSATPNRNYSENVDLIAKYIPIHSSQQLIIDSTKQIGFVVESGRISKTLWLTDLGTCQGLIVSVKSDGNSHLNHNYNFKFECGE